MTITPELAILNEFNVAQQNLVETRERRVNPMTVVVDKNNPVKPQELIEIIDNMPVARQNGVVIERDKNGKIRDRNWRKFGQGDAVLSISFRVPDRLASEDAEASTDQKMNVGKAVLSITKEDNFLFVGDNLLLGSNKVAYGFIIKGKFRLKDGKWVVEFETPQYLTGGSGGPIGEGARRTQEIGKLNAEINRLINEPNGEAVNAVKIQQLREQRKALERPYRDEVGVEDIKATREFKKLCEAKVLGMLYEAINQARDTEMHEKLLALIEAMRLQRIDKVNFR